MYRLLIVTTNQATKDMLASMEGWEALGVKPPRVRETVEDAVECMKKHPIDAIAVEDAPVFAPLADYLDRQAPAMPVFTGPGAHTSKSNPARSAITSCTKSEAATCSGCFL